MRARGKACLFGVLVAVHCVVPAGCTGRSTHPEPAPSTEPPAVAGPVGDTVGTVLAEGRLRIVAIDRSRLETEGEVTYRVVNIAGRGGDFSTCIQFHGDPRPPYPSPDLVETLIATSAKFTVHLAGGEETSVTERCAAPAGAQGDRPATAQPRTTRMVATFELPELTVARNASTGQRGSTFVNGKLECVGLSDLWDDASGLEVHLENVSSERIPGLFEVSAIFVDTGERCAPNALPALAPGQVARVRLDLTGVALGGRAFRVRVVPRRGSF